MCHQPGIIWMAYSVGPRRGRICMQIALFCYQLIKPQTKWQQSRLLYPNLFVLERRRATKSRTPRENLRFLPRESGAKIKSFECRDSPLAWAKRLGSLGERECVCETVFCKRASGLRAQMQNASALYGSTAFGMPLLCGFHFVGNYL